MKISISVPGRFHAFALAKQLHNDGHLHCLVTSLPGFEVKKHGIPLNKVKSIISKEILQRGYKMITGKYPDGVWLNNWFDFIASYKLPKDSDIYIIWSGFGYFSLRRLRKKNPTAKFILERGSAHIEVQYELLKLFNSKQEPINKRVIEKEKLEYTTFNYISIPGIFSRNTFLEKGILEQKLFINHYGVDLSIFKRKITIEKKEREYFIVGYAGAISNQKNVQGIINACKILIDKGCKIRLLLAGPIYKDSFSNDFFRQYDFIEYSGKIPEHELPLFYNQLDVFVLNSIQDGFGMVLLQAMAMGITPIATENTGGPDIIKNGENGFVIPIMNDMALAEKIQILMTRPALNVSLSEAAQLSVKQGFSWDDYGNRAITFYKSIYY